jgi:hypothetical protein
VGRNEAHAVVQVVAVLRPGPVVVKGLQLFERGEIVAVPGEDGTTTTKNSRGSSEWKIETGRAFKMKQDGSVV